MFRPEGRSTLAGGPNGERGRAGRRSLSSGRSRRPAEPRGVESPPDCSSGDSAEASAPRGPGWRLRVGWGGGSLAPSPSWWPPVAPGRASRTAVESSRVGGGGGGGGPFISERARWRRLVATSWRLIIARRGLAGQPSGWLAGQDVAGLALGQRHCLCSRLLQRLDERWGC